MHVNTQQDFIKITESEEDAEKTINTLLKAEDIIDRAVDAYWDEMVIENEYENNNQRVINSEIADISQ